MRNPSINLREFIIRDYLVPGKHRVGDKLPTTRELTAHYQTSITTVSKAIAVLAAEGWVTRRHGSGIYVAAVSPPTKDQSAKARPRIGHVTMSLRSFLAHRMFEGIEQVAGKRGYSIEVASTNWDHEIERQKIAFMREHDVQGVVLYPGGRLAGTSEYLAQEFRDFPIVVVDMYQPTMKRPHFIFDNYQAGRDMTQHLLDQGRSEIAFLKFSDAIPYRSVDDRLLGYRRALEDAGEPFVPERVIAFEGKGPMTKGHIEALERVLALSPRPTALITPYDPYAEASIEYLRSRGVAVPAELVVAGFDDLQEDTWGERFPTTQPNFVRMGERAAELLLERIGSRNFEPTEVVLPCPLVVPSATAGGIRQSITNDAISSGVA